MRSTCASPTSARNISTSGGLANPGSPVTNTSCRCPLSALASRACRLASCVSRPTSIGAALDDVGDARRGLDASLPCRSGGLAAETAAVGRFTGPMNRNPRRCTVWMYRGAAEESPSARRRSRMPLARAASLTIASRQTVVSSSCFVISRPDARPGGAGRRRLAARGPAAGLRTTPTRSPSRCELLEGCLAPSGSCHSFTHPLTIPASPAVIRGRNDRARHRVRLGAAGDRTRGIAGVLRPGQSHRSRHAPPSEHGAPARKSPGFPPWGYSPEERPAKAMGPSDRPASRAVPGGCVARALRPSVRPATGRTAGRSPLALLTGYDSTRRQDQCADYAMTAILRATAARGATS